MLMPKTARYGSWKSPITSDLIAAQSISLSEPRLDGELVYWLEGRPQELGRYVVVRANSLGDHGTDVTPKPYNARTRVHEYGGASWMVADGAVYFSDFADGRLYCQRNGAPHPLTPEPAVRERQWRFADGVIDDLRQCWIGVREDHTAGDGQRFSYVPSFVEFGEIERRAIPRHVGMIPRQPDQPAAVRRQTGRREEIMSADQHPPGLACRLTEIDGNDRVDRFPAGCVVFTHTDPALA